MSQDKVFADGFLFKRRENAPEFVIGCDYVFKQQSKKWMGKPQRAE